MLRMLLASWLLTLVLACGQQAAGPGDGSQTAATGAAAGDDAMRISQGSDLLSLDPYYKLESPTLSVQRNIFEPLTDYNGQTFELEPVLAESWKNTDATHWVFTLRHGVKFHEGQPFTAADVVFSMRRALEWANSRVASEIQTVKAVTAQDDFTVTVETAVPDAILPRRLASILILDKESAEPAIAKDGDAWLATHANGTGPYKLEKWSKDNPCILVANAGWWGPAPDVKRIIFDPTPVDTTRMAALKRGEFDLMLNVPPRYVGQAEALSNYRIVRQPGMRLIYLGLDCARDKSPGVPASPPSPLKDARVRRAMYLAIDNQLICKTIMGGNAEPTDQLFPAGVLGYLQDFRAPARPNLEEAKRLLTEAGFAQGFKVRLDGPNDRYVNDAQIMQAVAAQLARVGIQVEVNARPKAQFFADEEKGNCSFFLIGWANTNGDGFGTFDHLLHTPDATRRLGVANTSVGYSSKQVDALCEQAAQEFDHAKRVALLEEAHRLALNDLPHIPLHIQSDIYAISSRLAYTPRRDNHIHCVDFKWAATAPKK
jgi:peptide/nickel transport system substrate-binding protein